MLHDDGANGICCNGNDGVSAYHQFGGMVLTLTRIPLCLIVLLRDIYDSQYQLI